MNEKLSRVIRKLSACLSALFLIVGSSTCPVLADTTYYSYNYFGLNSSGTVYSINLSASTIHPVVFSVSYSSRVSYYTCFLLYAGGYLSQNDAVLASKPIAGIPKTDNGSGWVYNTPFSNNAYVGNYTNSSGQVVYYYYAYIFPLANVSTFYSSNNSFNNGAYTFNSCDLFTYTGAGSISANTVIGNYVRYKLDNNLPANYFIASTPSKQWLKTSDTITPAIDVSSLPSGDGSTSDDGSGGSSGGGSGSDSGGSSGGGSGGSATIGDQTQTQSQSIAEGAVAFTVEDGAFSLTQSQSIASDAVNNSYNPSQNQSIESNAVNVTVTNNNELTQENMQELNNIINNYQGNPEDDTDPFQEAVQNFKKFNVIALGFKALAGIVLGWLPWWVTAILGGMFSILSVMIVFRLLHLFI